MNKLYIVLAIVLLGCKSQQPSKEESGEDELQKTAVLVNECIDEHIALFAKNAQCERGAKVSSYIFQGELVYVFKEGPCTADMHEPVLDQNCKIIGQLGGFLGNTLINEVNFSEAVFQEVVWEQVSKK